MSEQREMYDEINALLGALAKALELTPEAVAAGLEAGSISLNMEEDERGERFISATSDSKTVRLYNGAIQYAPEAGDVAAEPAAEPAAAGKTGGCGTGGCGCGH